MKSLTMHLRPNFRRKDGKEHPYGSLVEPVRARWWKAIEVFNEQG